MSAPQDDFATRRADLAAQIARQRGELAEAYMNLEKPIRYTEYGMRGFGFIRSNPWIVAAVPVVYSLVTNFFGGKKKATAPVPSGVAPTDGKRLTGFKKIVTTGVGHGWRLYQLYRRVRPYFP